MYIHVQGASVNAYRKSTRHYCTLPNCYSGLFKAHAEAATQYPPFFDYALLRSIMHRIERQLRPAK